MVDFSTANHFKLKGKKAQPNVPLVFATLVRRYLRNKQKVFAIDFRKISCESKPSCKEPLLVADFLTNDHDIFLEELQGMPPEIEVDHTIELIPSVKLVAKAPFRHYFKEYVELRTQPKSC